MLDVPSITFLSNYLQGYPSTLLVVSHDRAFLDEVATDIVHQHAERLDYYKGANFGKRYFDPKIRMRDALLTSQQLRSTPLRRNGGRQQSESTRIKWHSVHIYKVRVLKEAMSQRWRLTSRSLLAFIDKFRYNAAKSSEAQSRIKKLEKMPHLEPPEAEYNVHFKFGDVEKLSPPIIQMSNVAFAYSKDSPPILRNVDLDVQLDSRIGIVGPNGAGKTTALKLLIASLQPTAGMVSAHARLRLAYFAQHQVDALDMNVSPVGFMGQRFPGRTDEEYRRHLGGFGITGTTGLQKMELLSGGQKSRVAFACLSMQNPHILILDEPSNHLDIEAMDALSDALRHFAGGVVMVSHDVTMLQNVCTSLWVCDQGGIEHFEGTVKDYKKRITAQAGEAGVVKQEK